MYGAFVRQVREARGLTQRELALVCGVGQSNISAIEHDRRAPSADTLNRLLVACGFELAATAGTLTIFCPLPQGGTFPDGNGPAMAGDPPDESPTITAGASVAERVEVITAVLDAADAHPRPVSLVDFVVEVHDTLARSGLAHAFGGALALAYVAEPRGTVDVDVNVFASVEEIDAVLDVFAEIGLRPEAPRERWVPVAGIRLRGGGPYPVDLFVSLDEPYDEVAARTVTHPFGPAHVRLPFLSPEDLAVFKVSFGREKDWVDLGRSPRRVATSTSTTWNDSSSAFGDRPCTREWRGCAGSFGRLVGSDEAHRGGEECVFCAIVAGDSPAHVVAADHTTLAFLDVRPVFPGHVLLVPREHYPTLADLPPALVAPLFGAAQRLARAVETAMDAHGTFVAMNNGVSQSVPHLHVHIIPRRRKDGLRGFFWPRQRYADEGEMVEVAARIRAATDDTALF